MLVRLKNVQRVVVGGKVYLYHRPTRTRLTEAPGSPEFAARVMALNAGKRAPRPGPVALGALLKAYRTSPEYTGLAANTKRNYDRCLEVLDTLADMPISAVDGPLVLGIRDRVYKSNGRSKANQMVRMIRTLWSFGKPRGLTKTSPSDGINPIPRPRGLKTRNRRWKPEELLQFLAACPHADIRLAVVIASQTGLRSCDVVGLKWEQYDGRAIVGVQRKTGDEHYNVVTPVLKAALDAAPRLGEYIVTVDGRPFKEAAFTSRFGAVNRLLAAKGLVAKGLTFHGLRHTVGAELADMGADTRTIMAATGHRSESSVATYTRDAERRRGAERAAELLQTVKPTVKKTEKSMKSTRL